MDGVSAVFVRDCFGCNWNVVSSFRADVAKPSSGGAKFIFRARGWIFFVADG